MNLRRALYISALVSGTSVAVVSQTGTTTPNPATVPTPQTPAATSPAAPPKDPTPPASQHPAPPPTQTAPAPASNQQMTPASNHPTAPASNQQMAPAGANPAGVPASPNGTQTNIPADPSATFGNLNQGGLTSEQLQQRIDSALHNEPTLSGSNLVVNVADDAIDLSGTVGTAKERLTARRIVQSFAGNRRVRERVTVSGGGAARSNEPGVNPPNAPKPTQDTGKAEEQKLNRPITNPAKDGDKSEDPR